MPFHGAAARKNAQKGLSMTLVYGHRGFSGVYPENTMLAFEKAYEAGADGIEFDVQLTKDGVPVIMHDENAVRTTGKDFWVKDLTLDEFKRLDAGYVKNGKFGFTPPPTLREVMAFCAEKNFRMNIELKTGVFEYEGIEGMVADMLKEFGLSDTVLVSSFNHFSMMRFRKIMPEIRIGLLEESWIINAGAYVKSLGADDYNPTVCFLNDETVADLRANGLGINTWTVNSEEEMRRTIRYGVEIGISNWPDRYLEIRREMCGK